MRLLPVLPYRTELNPVERIGDLIKADATANRVFESVQAIEKCIEVDIHPLWFEPQ